MLHNTCFSYKLHPSCLLYTLSHCMHVQMQHGIVTTGWNLHAKPMSCLPSCHACLHQLTHHLPDARRDTQHYPLFSTVQCSVAVITCNRFSLTECATSNIGSQGHVPGLDWSCARHNPNSHTVLHSIRMVQDQIGGERGSQCSHPPCFSISRRCAVLLCAGSHGHCEASCSGLHGDQCLLGDFAVLLCYVGPTNAVKLYVQACMDMNMNMSQVDFAAPAWYALVQTGEACMQTNIVRYMASQL